MKNIPAIVALLFLSTPALATTVEWGGDVNLHFSDVTPGLGYPVIDTRGMRLTAGTPNGFSVGTNWGTAGSMGIAVSGIGNTLEVLGGGTFTLEEFDMRRFSGFVDVPITVTGFYAGGGQVSEVFAITASYADDYVFSSLWQGLERVQFDVSGTSALYLDNVTMSSVVPVPAAVWLFGSALAALGLRRRTSTRA